MLAKTTVQFRRGPSGQKWPVTMPQTEISELTPKMQSIVRTYWAKRNGSGSEPSDYAVAQDSYDSCSGEFVRYTKERYPEMFEQPPEPSVDQEISVQLVNLIRGGQITENGYVLSFNDDSEGNWWLSYHEADTCHVFCFTDVEKPDSVSYTLVNDDRYFVTIDGLPERARVISGILDRLAQT